MLTLLRPLATAPPVQSQTRLRIDLQRRACTHPSTAAWRLAVAAMKNKAPKNNVTELNVPGRKKKH